MDQAPQISTVDQACALVRDWFGWKHDLAGSPIALPFAVPQAIETVNRSFGRLWLEDPKACGAVHLFRSQDTLISPHQYQPESDGVVRMIWENQGVWGCGFKPETGAQLWVTGDWPDDLLGSDAWRPTPDVVDTAIIFVLFANAMWASPYCELDEEEEKPPEADRLLFPFAPWEEFRGFWTDCDRSMIRMQACIWGLTARR